MGLRHANRTRAHKGRTAARSGSGAKPVMQGPHDISTGEGLVFIAVFIILYYFVEF